MKQLMTLLLVFGVFFLIGFMITFVAYGHDAPKGWAYASNCCNTIDCRPVDGPDARPRHHQIQVTEGHEGYTIHKSDGTVETIHLNDHRIRESKDGDYHWCSQGGMNTMSTICLYVPNRGY